MAEAEIVTTLPHEYFGNPDCCGCLTGIVCGDQAEIVCTECNAVIGSVTSTELRQTLTEMQLSLDVASANCPHCGAVHLSAGFSELRAFTCRQCGAVTKLADDPMADRLFG
jgi:tRNA(Ile2) C34 agmatinyltransferase TiaS